MTNTPFRNMQQVVNNPDRPILKMDANIQLPGLLLPSFRTSMAIQMGVEKNLILVTWGGIGDQICSEPTLRYAIREFGKSGCEVSLASEIPELFSHLNFKKVYNLKTDKVQWEKYFPFHMIFPSEHLNWEFFSHCLVNCVDYPSINAFRCQLPVVDRNVVLKPEMPKDDSIMRTLLSGVSVEDVVVIHAGKHWESKTFPKVWWDTTLDAIKAQGLIPVIVGKEIEAHQGTVDTNTEGCLDLRNKTTIMETVWLLQNANVVFCNDSSVMHMAMTGNAWVGFIATCKHPDYIMHFRKNQHGKNEWAWRQENLGLGGMWDVMDNCPNKADTVQVDKCDQALLESWLPDPQVVGKWCRAKMDEMNNE